MIGNNNSLLQWYREIPVVTRTYLTMAFVVTAACSLDILTPYRLYYSTRAVFKRHEYWRLITNFLFFGKLGLDWLFHMFFMSRYARALEESSFHNRPADFLWMLVIGGTLLSCMAPFTRVDFLGPSLAFMLVYVWARRNQYVTLQFMGLVHFTAPYLPWVLVGFAMALGHDPVYDLLGMAAGHIYYFLEDVYPAMFPHRTRPIQTPGVLCALLGQSPRDNLPPLPPVTVVHGARILRATGG
ncbi:unnamed protein product [Pedinophyceae sp. YPF-701]|nr:unnamed protein product [Pedinophyceae sp. YPF-701]